MEDLDNLKNLTVLELVHRFIDFKKTEYFNELVPRYSGKVYSICYNYLRNRDESKDATQDVFLRAYRGLMKKKKSDFDSETVFTAWLNKITRNLLIDVLRRKKVDRKKIDSLAYVINYNSRSYKGEETIVLDVDMYLKIKRVVEEGLSHHQKRCFMLFSFDRYELTDNSFKKLRSKNLSENVLNQLQSFPKIEFGLIEFFYKLEQRLGEPYFLQHHKTILETAERDERKKMKQIKQIEGYKTVAQVRGHIQAARDKLRQAHIRRSS